MCHHSYFSPHVLSELRSPPGVVITVTQPIRAVGEVLLIQCVCTNPNYEASITWTHTSGQVGSLWLCFPSIALEH